MLHRPQTKIAVIIFVLVHTVVSGGTPAIIAAIVQIFIHTIVRQDLIAEITPIITVVVGAGVCCQNLPGQ